MCKHWLIFLVTYTNTFAGTLIQLRDFLCGCEYCVTVPTQEPLDIGRHMIMCHGWRESTLKTMRVMEELKQQREQAEKKIEQLEQQPVEAENEQSQLDITNYTWAQDETLGHVFSEKSISMYEVDQWIYSEQLEWVWTMANVDNFIYSYNYGWLYVTRYKWYRGVYWYDRRIWKLAKSFKN